MDDDSSTKFIESLTKFLQSLCNGYVEFQRGVELVGHIYLNIDTGEKVDYILHEKVSKNDENSVTFVSNSFHALPKDKDTNKTPAGASASRTSDMKASSDDDDIVILDQPDSVPGSTNSGTVTARGVKRAASASFDQRRSSALLHRSQSGGSNRQFPSWRNRQQSGSAASASSQGMPQQNISIGEVKLEQLSSDELLSLASQVGDGSGSSSSQMQGRAGGMGRSDHGSFSSNDAPGQQWVKQEPMDEAQEGLDTGWPQSDSSNSGSNLYPVMMHQNSAAFTSSPVMPGFSSTSGSASSRHGLSQSLPGTSGAANPFANPMPGTSQNASGMDPSDVTALALEGNEDLQKVYEAVMRIRSRELTLRKAAELYGIPRSTLSDRVLGRVRLLARRVKRHRYAPETEKSKKQISEKIKTDTDVDEK